MAIINRWPPSVECVGYVVVRYVVIISFLFVNVYGLGENAGKFNLSEESPKNNTENTENMSENFTLTILHTNDVNGKYDERNFLGKACLENAQCFGGVSRRASMVKKIKHENENVILVDAGNQFFKLNGPDEKTIKRFERNYWLEYFKGKATAHLMNMIGYDAMAVGENELYYGDNPLTTFVQNATFDVLSCNARLKRKDVSNIKEIKKSSIINRNGRKIGFIGYLLRYDRELDNTELIRSEVEKIKKQGINIIIALANDPPENCEIYAKEIPDIDVFICAHNARHDNALVSYPKIVKRDNHSDALLAVAYQDGLYLGYVKVTFDAMGNLISHSGNPILLNETIPKDEYVEREYQQLSKELDREHLSNEIIGKLHLSQNFKLDGSRCCQGECTLGNLITDAMVEKIDTAPLAIWSCSRINASIKTGYEGTISLSDVIKAFPHDETVDIVKEVSGEQLRRIFEHSVSDLEKKRFLQVSGMRVKYDLSKKIGRRVVELKALNSSWCECEPSYVDVRDDEKYDVLMGSHFLDYKYGLNDGYNMTKKLLSIETKLRAISYVVDYVNHSRPLFVPIEGRITFVSSNASILVEKSSLYVFLLTLFAVKYIDC